MMVLPGSCHFESLVSYVSERMFAECDGRMVFNYLEDGILNFMIRAWLRRFPAARRDCCRGGQQLATLAPPVRCSPALLLIGAASVPLRYSSCVVLLCGSSAMFLNPRLFIVFLRCCLSLPLLFVLLRPLSSSVCCLVFCLGRHEPPHSIRPRVADTVPFGLCSLLPRCLFYLLFSDSEWPEGVAHPYHVRRHFVSFGPFGAFLSLPHQIWTPPLE